MLNNQAFIRAQLCGLGLGGAREQEIIRELSEHLEDHAAALEKGGMPKEVAARAAFDAISDWPAFRREIRAAELEEENMNYRTRVLWLPALAALTLSNVLLALIELFGPLPHFYILHPGKGMEIFCVFIVPWLLTQPLVGAITAWWSRRAGGVIGHQLLAALAPSIALLIVFVLILPWAMIVDRQVTHSVRMTAFLVLTVTWVLLPALPLLLGAAPFLRKSQVQS